MRIILLGAPGSGKGTQAERLAEITGMTHISSGDIFRQAEKEGSELGKLAKSYMEKGLLVPDEVVTKMVLDRIAGNERGFILDGFPRTIEQAESLDKALREDDIDKAVYIKVSQDELLRRLSGRWICRQCEKPYHLTTSPPKVAGRCDVCGGQLYQRPDDTTETAEKRLKVYFEQTAPLVDYYRKKGRLLEMDGERQIEEVSKDLLSKLRW
ncbi:MAG: adenylate kinase [Chloroflexi bacterium RBG_13_53_26]|nr:MAG: adenylate kinase [Chloroflexi bacterium RBG_13_53_26]